jgi:tetratricopeptide (TPR) repeat protein
MNDLLTTCQKHGLDYKDYQQLVPQNARSRKIFASLLAQQGSWEQGKREYRNAITLAKGQSEYYHAMLDACKKHHDYQCMRTLWQELWQQSPQNLELPIRIAESFAQQHMLKQAVEQYQAVLQKHPEAAPRIYQRVAELYQQQGKNEEALHSYTQLLEIKSDDPKIYHAVAAMYRQRKDLNAAINIYKQAIETGLAQPDIYSSLGSLYLQSGNEKDAIEAYNQAIQNGEPRIEIYQALERLYQAQGNKIGLDLLWDTYAVVNRHHPKALYQLAQYYQSNGKWLKAVTLSKEMIANAPTNATYRKFLAGLYEQKKMLHESVEQWEKIVKLHSGNVEYKLYLASLYEKVNLIDDAKMLYRKILRIQPNNQHARQKLSSLGG